MKLDRDLQRKVLENCASIYPQLADPKKLMAECGIRPDSDEAIANIAYLAEHGLVSCELRRYSSGPPALSTCAITARGLDFLADDGGLTAILGTVVVKLHADTIRDMLLAKAEASTLPAAEKTALRKQIEAFPAAVLQAAASRLTQEGLAHVPDILQWVRSVAGL